MKTVGYLIFAGFFYIYRFFCRVQTKKVFGIMTHDGSVDGNVGAMIEYLKDLKEGYTFHCIKKSDRMQMRNLRQWKGKISFFVIKPYHLATSKYIMLDNVFLPMAYIRFCKKVQVIQLWHGTGTIKKFGQDVNSGRLKELERRANSRITHLIVNSEETKQEYAGAFGVQENKVFIYGLPRTDLFFDQDKIEKRRQKFFDEYQQLRGKKLVLYAPTFRDDELKSPKLALDIERLCRELPKDYVFLLRLHPYLTEIYKKNGMVGQSTSDNLIIMSSYGDINTLLLVSDYLITDYSSLTFEYCLRRKPIIFYAYDLDKFSDFGRGFYRSYENYVPGPVAKNTDEVKKLLENDQFDLDRINVFADSNYKYLDGKASERLYLHIFKN